MKIASTTNVRPRYLNYVRYLDTRYDRDIVRAIPFHRELHEIIARYIASHYPTDTTDVSVLDLGAGTALTSAVVRSVIPKAHFDVVDFSTQMLRGARRRLGRKNVRYIRTDYASWRFPRQYNIVVSVISLHHQNRLGMRRLIKKIYRHLKPGGIFILGDLVTYKNKHMASLNTALHYHHLVERAVNKRALGEWAYHHLCLNDLKTFEDHGRWLVGAGFAIKKTFHRLNTALFIAQKNKKSLDI